MNWQPTETGFVQLDGDRIVSSLVRTDAGFTLYDHESTNDAETTPKVVGVLVSADTERLDYVLRVMMLGKHGRETLDTEIDAAKEQS